MVLVILVMNTEFIKC